MITMDKNYTLVTEEKATSIYDYEDALSYYISRITDLKNANKISDEIAAALIRRVIEIHISEEIDSVTLDIIPANKANKRMLLVKYCNENFYD